MTTRLTVWFSPSNASQERVADLLDPVLWTAGQHLQRIIDWSAWWDQGALPGGLALRLVGPAPGRAGVESIEYLVEELEVQVVVDPTLIPATQESAEQALCAWRAIAWLAEVVNEVGRRTGLGPAMLRHHETEEGDNSVQEALISRVLPSGPGTAPPEQELSSMDPLDDLPAESRTDVVAAVMAAWQVDPSGAEDILRASEPFWNTLEACGGVDMWGGSEFCSVFPPALALIRQQANSPERG